MYIYVSTTVATTPTRDNSQKNAPVMILLGYNVCKNILP